tara:strand:+ start:30432 stop:31709 length:1278 start_codon:yes stop_codon:yes gene_type:complete
MKYKEAVEYLESLQGFGSGPGVEKTKKLLAFFDSPQKRLQYVHVSGSNGKGSTCAMINEILIAAGYKVGLFTSPHLYKYNERIKVNNKAISDKEFVEYTKKIRHLIEKVRKKDESLVPGVFQVMTIMAFLYFADKKIDIGIIEVGIGGEFDSTNVIENNFISIITNIALEHTTILGTTKEKVAKSKAGIIKQGSIVITSEKSKQLKNIFKKKAKNNNEVIELDEKDIIPLQQTRKGQKFHFKDLKNLEIPFLGKHQLENGAVAILCAQSLRKCKFNITDNHIRRGLKKSLCSLRLEVVHEKPLILIDVGHNVHGIKTIHKVMEDVFLNKKRVLVFGCSYNKDYSEMISILSKEANTIIVTEADYHGVDPKELSKHIPTNKKVYQTKNVQEAIKLAKDISNKKGMIMVFGGLYLGAEAKKAIDKIF